ncbi:MAG: hypothetical protein KDJ37_17105 [Hyphomicrobiaceae bacterium]|nr:hypothetical protein [Hyphomicrobiaceae bacterium]
MATAPIPAHAALRDLVLVRIAVDGGATRVETIRDVGQMVSHRLSPGEWRQTAEAALAELVADGLADDKRGRYLATQAGLARAASYLTLRKPGPLGTWATVRDSLVIARALGLEAESAPKLKALATPEGLRALIVQKAFGLPRRVKSTPARLRAELAVVALERAFGNKIKTGLGSGTGLSAKAGRLLAGQLSRRPRDFGSDSRLIAALAAEQADAVQPTLDVLRTSILKRFVSETLDGGTTAAAPASPRLAASSAAAVARPPAGSPRPVAANDTGPGAGAAASGAVAGAGAGTGPSGRGNFDPGGLTLVRPDLEAFVGEVIRHASRFAEGWPGNRKAFISHVWPSIRDGRPEWGLSEIEFKCMLVEAHRAGGLALASADLKNKNNIKDLQDSAISYMNTVWHYVRVED